MPLDAGLEDALRNQLSAQLQKDIQMETAVDPSLIGGMVLQIEDKVIDNSLRGRLEALAHSMN
ncbi:ATP synthase subunit delta [compost metagenome]